MTTKRSLAGKIVLVTGASSGIGAAIAVGCAREGATLVLAARRAAELANVAAEARRHEVDVLAVPTDVTDPKSVDALMGAVRERHDGLDIVMGIAGGNTGRGEVAEIDAAEWIACLNLNVTGGFLTARAAVPLLEARGGGRIVLMGSGMGHRGNPGHSAYCAGKAAQWMLVRCLAEELKERNISVNELIPGPVITPPTIAEMAEGGATSGFSSPGEWRKQPEDVVPMALFLATCPDPGPTAQSFSLMRRQG